MIENYFKFEVCTVFRVLQAEGVRQLDSLQVNECLQAEGSVCVVQQIQRWLNVTH
jgi:hypothetical protein